MVLCFSFQKGMGCGYTAHLKLRNAEKLRAGLKIPNISSQQSNSAVIFMMIATILAYFDLYLRFAVLISPVFSLPRGFFSRSQHQISLIQEP